jgi:hypothetical protein
MAAYRVGARPREQDESKECSMFTAPDHRVTQLHPLFQKELARFTLQCTLHIYLMLSVWSNPLRQLITRTTFERERDEEFRIKWDHEFASYS